MKQINPTKASPAAPMKIGNFSDLAFFSFVKDPFFSF